VAHRTVPHDIVLKYFGREHGVGAVCCGCPECNCISCFFARRGWD